MVRLWWNFWTLMLEVRWRTWRIQKRFEYVAILPRDDAMRIITRWRWDITHATGVDERFREIYLEAIERVAQIVEEP